MSLNRKLVDGSLLMRDGVIEAVGRMVSDGEALDVVGKMVVQGLVDVYCNAYAVGLGELPLNADH